MKLWSSILTHYKSGLYGFRPNVPLILFFPLYKLTKKGLFIQSTSLPH